MEQSFSEFQDRISRSHNIILFKVPERTSPNPASDDELARQTLGKVKNLDLGHITARRLGKVVKNDSIRPLLVSFKSPEEALCVLRNKKLLPTNISASADRTPGQRAMIKGVYDKVNAHNSSYPDNQKTVKFINGVLTIVDSISNSPGNRLVAKISSSPKNSKEVVVSYLFITPMCTA